MTEQLHQDSIAAKALSPASARRQLQLDLLRARLEEAKLHKHDLRCTPLFDVETLTSSGKCICGKDERIAQLESEIAAPEGGKPNG